MTTLPFGIGGVFCINLDERVDRRIQVEQELETIGLPFERFPAIKGTPGLVGCSYSHLAVLKEARRREYSSVLIIEDDFEFLVGKEEFWDTMRRSAETISSFDVIMLGYNIQRAVPHSIYFNKVLEAQTTSAYIVHSNMYSKLIDLYEWSTPLLQSTGQHWIYANDQIWKRLQPNSQWYAFKTRIGKQRAGYSDCAENYVDYGV